MLLRDSRFNHHRQYRLSRTNDDEGICFAYISIRHGQLYLFLRDERKNDDFKCLEIEQVYKVVGKVFRHCTVIDLAAGNILRLVRQLKGHSLLRE